jgi:hypothetical protein
MRKKIVHVIFSLLTRDNPGDGSGSLTDPRLFKKKQVFIFC